MILASVEFTDNADTHGPIAMNWFLFTDESGHDQPPYETSPVK
jgi:hypothetical protein